ncbi:hypothetical protein RUM43_006896 [Polyplax serrata]|uniref:Tubulin alpha chain n=1 Tax=Polyplax serrata TaxID=468196 RepID=A0AAN8S8F8_POLSC
MARNSEIISIHVGQAGCQLGSACWEMFCIEHNIRYDGIMCCEKTASPPVSFFRDTGAGKVVPRGLFVDLEPSVVDEIRTGKYRKLFNPKNLVTGKEDASNCFAKGYFSPGREILDFLLQRLRSTVEECNHLQGFFIYRAFGGGTGSGLTASILESLHEQYPKSILLELSIFPAPKLSSIVVEPYNAALTTHLSLEHSIGTFIVDNEACYDICNRSLDVCNPTFANINRLMGHVISAVTSSLRYEGDVNVDLNEIRTNLIPYPRIQYPLISYAPLTSQNRAVYENTSVNSLLGSCFEPAHQMVKCDNRKGKYISCALLFQGDVVGSSVNAAISSIKARRAGNFVDWCPTGFKVGINNKPPLNLPDADLYVADRSCLMLANSTAVRTVWEKIARKFQILYDKRAFLHWYLEEGLEEADFQDTKLDLEALDMDYREVEA